MAVENMIRHQTGMHIFKLFRSIFADVYRQTNQYYFELGLGNTITAIEHLKNAITKPANVQNRIQYFNTTYGTSETVAAINQVSDGVTAGKLNSELTTMVNYCDNMKTQLEAETMTWDSAASQLLGHFENIMPKIEFPHSPGYTDIWGR